MHASLRIHGQLQQIVDSAQTPESAMEQLFILILSRKPTDHDVKGLRMLVGEQTNDVAV